MVSAIQAVPIFATALPLSAAVQPKLVVPGVNSSSSTQSASLALSNGSPTPLTYNSTGTLGSATQNTANIVETTATEAILNSATAGQTNDLLSTTTLSASPTAIAPDNTPAPAKEDAAASNVNTTSNVVVIPNAVTIAAPPPPSVAANVVAMPDTTPALPINLTVDPADQALSNIAADPAYAGMASSLYVNVSIYRTQQTSTLALSNIKDVPQPVAGTSTAGMVIDSGGQSDGAQFLAQDFLNRQTQKSFTSELKIKASESEQISG